eukprot:355369-Chlamydomonas_euryale.AAC.18
MDRERGARRGRQDALEDLQLHALVRDLVAAAQQLERLRLRRARRRDRSRTVRVGRGALQVDGVRSALQELKRN